MHERYQRLKETLQKVEGVVEDCCAEITALAGTGAQASVLEIKIYSQTSPTTTIKFLGLLPIEKGDFIRAYFNASNDYTQKFAEANTRNPAKQETALIIEKVRNGEIVAQYYSH